MHSVSIVDIDDIFGILFGLIGATRAESPIFGPDDEANNGTVSCEFDFETDLAF